MQSVDSRRPRGRARTIDYRGGEVGFSPSRSRDAIARRTRKCAEDAKENAKDAKIFFSNRIAVREPIVLHRRF